MQAVKKNPTTEVDSKANKKQHKTPTLKSVDRAFYILNCFTHENPDYSLNELAKKLHVSKGTVHRTLLTAQKRGIIEQNSATGRYQLGMKVFEFGSIVMKRMNLRSVSKPVLEKVSEQTGETTFIVTKDGDEAVCIESVEGHNYIRSFLTVGKRMPLYVGAAPRVLLAYLSNEEIEEFLKRQKIKAWTDYTNTDSMKIWEGIDQIREKGYAVSYEDVTIGAAAVGSPIMNASGEVIGAVSISGLSKNFQGSRLEALTSIIMDASRKISQGMGFII